MKQLAVTVMFSMKSESTKFENLTKSSFLECFSGW